MKENVAENPFGTIIGKNSFFRAVSVLDNMQFSEDTDIEACIMGCPNIGSNNGLTVIVSDFFTESNWKKAVDYLCYKHKQVLLVQVLAPEEVDPAYDGRVNLIDSESVDLSDTKNMKIRITPAMRKAYAEALSDFKKDIKTFSSKRGADYVSVCSDTPIERMLFRRVVKSRYHVMKLLTPLGLLGLLGIAVLILIYVIKPNYQQKTVSSTFVWKLSLKYKKKRVQINKLRNVLLILCQVLVLTACALILAEPNRVVKAETDPSEVIAIIDSSASMRAQKDGESRFERAVKKSLSLSEEVFSNGGLFSVILADENPSFL